MLRAASGAVLELKEVAFRSLVLIIDTVWPTICTKAAAGLASVLPVQAASRAKWLFLSLSRMPGDP